MERDPYKNILFNKTHQGTIIWGGRGEILNCILLLVIYFILFLFLREGQVELEWLLHHIFSSVKILRSMSRVVSLLTNDIYISLKNGHKKHILNYIVMGRPRYSLWFVNTYTYKKSKVGFTSAARYILHYIYLPKTRIVKQLLRISSYITRHDNTNLSPIIDVMHNFRRLSFNIFLYF